MVNKQEKHTINIYIYILRLRPCRRPLWYRCTLSSLVKLIIGRMYFSLFFVFFEVLRVHFGGPGLSLASFWTLGAPRAVQDLILFIFLLFLKRFGRPGSAKRSPKERKGDQNGPQSGPEGIQRRPQKVTFLKLAKPWIWMTVQWFSWFFGVREGSLVVILRAFGHLCV